MTDKFAFIDAEKAMFPIVKMCTWLDVSTSGYYEWRDRPASATVQRRQRLAAVIQAIFEDSDSTYGYRRVHAALVRQGDGCGPELVREIMRELGLVPCQPRPWRPTTTLPGDGAAAVPTWWDAISARRCRAGNWSEISPICRHGRVSLI